MKQIPWHSGEPNGGRGGNCLIMHRHWGYNFGDFSCVSKFELLCQKTLH